jgi:hypothetical protein
MPGGFARVGSTPTRPRSPCSAAARRRRLGGLGQAGRRVSLLPQEGERLSRNSSRAALPSRAADNLFWLGRYAERCEGTMRILRAYHVRLAEVIRTRAAAAGDYARDYLEDHRHRRRRGAARRPAIHAIDSR